MDSDNDTILGLVRVLLIALCLASCGRINFDLIAQSDGAAEDDAGLDDAGLLVFDADPLENGLLYHFEFEGDLLTDSTGQHNSECTSCPTPGEGRVGGGASFDGTTQCIFVQDAPDLRPATFTLTIWAKLALGSTTTSLVGRTFNGETSFNNTREIYFTPTGGFTAHTSGVDLNDNALSLEEWHHIALVYDGSTMRLYTDGVSHSSTPLASIEYSDAQDRIGCDLNNGTLFGFLDGQVDEVRLYNRALSPTEVAVLAAM